MSLKNCCLAPPGSAFKLLWDEICDQAEAKEKAWVNKLQTQGIKAAHPDDGWVKRQENKVLLCYPYFKGDIQIGDKIVLGSPNEYRTVEVVEIEQSKFFSELIYYKFKEL